MTGIQMTRMAIAKLPERIGSACRNTAALCGGRLNEIRLRRNSPVSLTVRGENILLPVCATEEEITKTVRVFCDMSIYHHAETICEGYIASSDGFRVGICGRAVLREGRIVSVADVSSLNIRIPERVKGCADRAYSLMAAENFRRGMLVWSVPGMGKTTLLRELAYRISTGKSPKRLAIVDSRAELSAGIEGTGIIDILSAYPRAQGIEIARRTLSPQVLICDEIAGEADMRALLEAHNSGITVAASAHASSRKGLFASEIVSSLDRAGVFGIYYGITSHNADEADVYLKEV